MNRHTYEPYLSRQSWTAPELARIGFFDDGLSERELEACLNDTRWVTPTHHLSSTGLVLVTTGAFSPFHGGHLRMLEIAKTALEGLGLKVAGAYVVPDHDGYVSVKNGGTAACPASERIYQAQLALKDHPWIQVDPWAALYQDYPLNYTTILERLSRYIGYDDYKVVYVFGSDNEGFKEAFAFDPRDCFCVGRPGASNPHPDALDISSTQVRACQATSHPLPTKECPYLIRDDLDWATEQWGVYPRETTIFWADLNMALFDAVGQSPRIISTETQIATLAEMETKWHQSYINFDRVTGGTHWISRVFQPHSLQDKPTHWTHSDLSLIPAGEYALIDDDIASGGTVEAIKRYTPQVNWTETISMTDWCVERPWFDVVDARDFLFGAKGGGLWVDLGKGDFTRVPYITPFVNLTTRAKIPPAAQPAFVRAVIEANIRFFEQVVVLAGITDSWYLWDRLGYKPETPMLTICKDLLKWNPN